MGGISSSGIDNRPSKIRNREVAYYIVLFYNERANFTANIFDKQILAKRDWRAFNETRRRYTRRCANSVTRVDSRRRVRFMPSIPFYTRVTVLAQISVTRTGGNSS